AEALHPVAEGVAAAVLAEHQAAARQPDFLRTHDLVRGMVLEHAVLMDAGFVRERVFAYYRLVARHRHARDVRDETRSRVEAGGLHVRAHVEERVARAQRHHDFLERTVARALADAVDRALDLARAGDHGGEAVGDRHAEIIVTVDGKASALDAAHVLPQ